MANNLVKYTLFDGPRRSVIRFLNVNALNAETLSLVEPEDLSPVPTRFVIDRIWHNTYAVILDLYWDVVSDIPIIHIPASRGPDYLDFRSFGGLYDNSGGSNGNILLTTRLEAAFGVFEQEGQNQIITSAHSYDLTLDLRKKYD